MPHYPIDIQPQRLSWPETAGATAQIARNQKLAYWIFRALGNTILTSRRIELEESDLVHGSRYVLASNHQAALDPFIVCSQVPMPIWRHVGTVHYFAANRFMNKPLIHSIMVRLGAFPAKPHHLYPSGLDFAFRQLRLGQSVLIFPEGQRALRGEVKPRRGVEALANDPSVMIIPVHIEWRVRGWRRSFSVGVGKPFEGSGMSAEAIMERVYALPVG